MIMAVMNMKIYEHRLEALGESYFEWKHPSGVTIFVYPRPESDGVYALYGARCGSVDDNFIPYGETEAVTVPKGIAHFLEHKLFESEELGAFERYAKTGANANAYTSFDRTCYLFSCGGNFEQSFEILLDFVQSPYFTEQTVAKEQGIIGQEISMYDNDPSWMILADLLEAMYEKDHIRYSIAGTAESISEITADMLYKCYNAFYHPDNMAICVAGRVTCETVAEITDRLLKDSGQRSPRRIAPEEPDAVLKPYTERKMDVAAPLFMFGFKDTGLSDGPGKLKESILAGIAFNAMFGSCTALYDRLLSGGLINESFGCEYFRVRNAAAFLMTGESSDPEKVREEILAELERVKKNGLDEKPFQCALRSAYGQLIGGMSSNAGICSDLIEGFMNGEYVDDNLSFAASIKKEQAESFIRERINADMSVLSVVKPIQDKLQEDL